MGGLGLEGGLWRNAGGLKEEAMRACHHDCHHHCVRARVGATVRVYPMPRKADKHLVPPSQKKVVIRYVQIKFS
jgi:hypothetical protein